MADPVQIIGTGPVGLALALRLAADREVILYRLARDAGKGSAPDTANPSNGFGPRHSIEAVPAGVVAHLVELGVHPGEIGVDMLHHQKHVAWESGEAQCVVGSATAHVERPGLEAALLRCALATPKIKIRSLSRQAIDAVLDKMPRDLYDVTGRRALTAVSREVVGGGPVARTWTRTIALPPERRGFRMAALPDGYVYALASATRALIGWCGNKRLLALPPQAWHDYLRTEHIALFDDFALQEAGNTEWVQGRTGAAGVQRAIAQTGCSLVGDAAFSRDTLCAQGLAIGLSDAVYGAKARTDRERLLWQQHRDLQYASHLRFLSGTIARCRFRQSAFWKTYAAFLATEQLNFAATCSREVVV